MRIIFISGDGHGAGKTYLAKNLASSANQIFAIANTIRIELSIEFPKYDWFNKEPRYKDYTIVKETNKTIRQMLDERGKLRKSKNTIYWAKMLIDTLKYSKDVLNLEIAVIDDLRYLDEFEFIKRYFEKEHITHIHVINPHAKPEPLYENEKLKELADYHVISKRVLNFRKDIEENILEWNSFN